MTPPPTDDPDGPTAAASSDRDGFPWYVKVLLAVALLVTAVVIVLDLLVIAGGT